jgi:hypothetical protein
MPLALVTNEAAENTHLILEVGIRLSYNGLMNTYLRLALCLTLISCSATQGPPPKGSQTGPAYSSEQLREFNNQAISPAEGPFGPVATPENEIDVTKKPPRNSKYFSPPQGEQEAEAIETQSAEPYTPMSTPVYRF